jgi:hypothetical protein
MRYFEGNSRVTNELRPQLIPAHRRFSMHLICWRHYNCPWCASLLIVYSVPNGGLGLPFSHQVSLRLPSVRHFTAPRPLNCGGKMSILQGIFLTLHLLGARRAAVT